jgi:hypothetical protein
MNALIDLENCREYMTITLGGRDHQVRLAGILVFPARIYTLLALRAKRQTLARKGTLLALFSLLCCRYGPNQLSFQKKIEFVSNKNNLKIKER